MITQKLHDHPGYRSWFHFSFDHDSVVFPGNGTKKIELAKDKNIEALAPFNNG